MESVFITTRKQRIIREMRDYMMIALGMLMYSIGWTVFFCCLTTSRQVVCRYCFYCILGNRCECTVYLFCHKWCIVGSLPDYFGMEVQCKNCFCRIYHDDHSSYYSRSNSRGCIYCMTSLLWRVLSVLLSVAVVLEWHFRLTEAPEERILLPLLLINIVILP